MKGKDLILKILVEISRFVLGATFIFSGFVKAVDPMGTAYKIQDYFIAFGLESLSGLSLALSIAQIVLEFALGVFLVLGIYRRVTTILILLVMLFMTPLTLYLAIANPVEDCGCFGDAFIITNWQTFYKNIVLLAASILTVWRFYLITNFFTGKFYWAVGIFTILYITAFSFYNIVYEPVFDFRPYKIGANLAELKKVENDEFQYIYIYEKDGVEKEFNQEEYEKSKIWEDPTWNYVAYKDSLIRKGKVSEIQDFIINKQHFNPEKNAITAEDDITDEVFTDSGYVFLMIAYSLPEAGVSYLESFEDVSNYAKDNGYKFYCLTNSSPEEILKWQDEYMFFSDTPLYCRTDERALKTATRSNPGLILLKNGVVINKWADLEVPRENDLIKPLDELGVDRTGTIENTHERWWLFLTFAFVLPLVAIKIFDFIIYQRKREKKLLD